MMMMYRIAIFKIRPEPESTGYQRHKYSWRKQYGTKQKWMETLLTVCLLDIVIYNQITKYLGNHTS